MPTRESLSIWVEWIEALSFQPYGKGRQSLFIWVEWIEALYGRDGASGAGGLYPFG